MNKTTRLKKPQIPELDTLYQFDDLGGRPKYGGVEMTSTTDIPSFEEIQRHVDGAIAQEAAARGAADDDLQEAIESEEADREEADANLQSEIDAIVASSDVKDVVGTKAELDNYDTSTLGDNDIIKVLQDETQQNQTTYYRWGATAETFTLIGAEGPYYTKAATDALLATKQDVLTLAQTTGTSTTDIMSQNATTSMVYADPATKKRIQIGNNTVAGNSANYNSIAIGDGAKAYTGNDVVIGNNAQTSNTGASTYGGGNVAIGKSAAVGTNNTLPKCNVAIGDTATTGNNYSIAVGANTEALGVGSIALGSYATTTSTQKGVMNIGSTSTSYGYSSSNYRLLTGLYDPQSAHDAATKGYVDGLVGDIAAALNAINNGGGN